MDKCKIREMCEREFKEIEEGRRLNIPPKPEETGAVRIVRNNARYGIEIGLIIILVFIVFGLSMGAAGMAIVIPAFIIVAIVYSLIHQKAVRDLNLDKDNHYVFGSSCKCREDELYYRRSSANPLNPRSPWFLDK